MVGRAVTGLYEVLAFGRVPFRRARAKAIPVDVIPVSRVKGSGSLYTRERPRTRRV